MKNSEKSFYELNELMVGIEIEDEIVLKHFHRFLLIPYQSSEIDLQLFSANALFRFHIPLANQIKGLLNDKAISELPELFRGRLIELIQGYRIIAFQLDKLPVIDFVPVNTPVYTADNLDTIRWQLGPLYQDKIMRNVITIVAPDDSGYSVETFESWDQFGDNFFKEMLLKYYNWFINNAEKIIPVFQEIKEEIKGILESEYKISPSQDGFVSWFINYRLGGIKTYLETLKNIKNHVNEYTSITPSKIEEDLHEYCQLRANKQHALVVITKQKNSSNKSTLSSSTQSSKKNPFTEIELKQYVQEILSPLGGYNPQRQLIMSKENFERLIIYTEHLVINKSLPNDIIPITQTGISNEHIRYTYYLLHKELFTTKKRFPVFYDFLHSVFKQFKGTELTSTAKHFSRPPKSYYMDFAGDIGDK